MKSECVHFLLHFIQRMFPIKTILFSCHQNITKSFSALCQDHLDSDENTVIIQYEEMQNFTLWSAFEDALIKIHKSLTMSIFCFPVGQRGEKVFQVFMYSRDTESKIFFTATRQRQMSRSTVVLKVNFYSGVRQWRLLEAPRKCMVLCWFPSDELRMNNI